MELCGRGNNVWSIAPTPRPACSQNLGAHPSLKPGITDLPLTHLASSPKTVEEVWFLLHPTIWMAFVSFAPFKEQYVLSHTS